MILALALLAAAPQVAGIPDDPRAQAVAAKLARLRLRTRVNDAGQMTDCRVQRSSGDAVFDREACRVTRSCAELGEATRETTDTCVRDQLMKLAVRQELGR